MSEHDVLIDEGLLRDALQSRRADASVFDAAVRQRIAEREAARTADDAIGREPAWLRIAAGWLPPGLAKSSGWKSVLAVVAALPGLLLVAIVVTFLAAIRRLRPLRAHAVEGVQDIWQFDGEGRWRSALSLAGWLLYIALTVVFSPDVMVAVLLVSMWVFLSWLRRVDERGTAGRIQIASVCGLLLWLLFAFSLLIGFQYGHRLLPAISLCGVIGCGLLGGRLGRRSGGGGVVIASVLVAATWLTVAVALTGGVPTANDVRQYVEGQTDPRDADEWERVLRAARAIGLGPFDITTPSQAFAADRDSPFVRGAAARAGVLRDAGATTAEARELLQRTGPIRFLDQRVAAIVDLARRGELSDGERDALRDRLMASLPRDGAYRDLEAIERVAYLLGVVGRPDAAAALREPALAALGRQFVTGKRHAAWRVGFAAGASLRFPDEASTTAAVELMARFGVPAEVDLARLRRSLRDVAAHRGWFGSHHRYAQLVAMLTAARIDQLWPSRMPAWQATMLDLRLEIAVALFVLLCLHATWRSPRDVAAAAT